MSRLLLATFLGLVLSLSAPLYSAESPANLLQGTPSCWIDADGDGFGDQASPDPACNPGSVENDSDCDDTKANVYPGAVDIVGNDVDENCDSTLACWQDLDVDGYGRNSSAEGFQSCTDPGASVFNNDCDDNNHNVYPGAVEIVGNDVDENCDGTLTCWLDQDSDGFGGNSTVNKFSCMADGASANNADCDDSSASVFPGAFDNPVDGVDANCDEYDYDAGADTDTDTRNDREEDTNKNGDVSDDDFDADNIPNYLDVDDDDDSVPTAQELDEDTDGDGWPNFLDIDDDDDTVPTINEDVDLDGDPTNDDTDADGIPNYLDIDDDNDGMPTPNEDVNGNGDPTDDDTDDDGIPNYLDADDTTIYEDGFEDPPLTS